MQVVAIYIIVFGYIIITKHHHIKTIAIYEAILRCIFISELTVFTMTLEIIALIN